MSSKVASNNCNKAAASYTFATIIVNDNKMIRPEYLQPGDKIAIVAPARKVTQIGLTELLNLFGIVFFLFGVKRLPEVGNGIGEGMQNFKNAMRRGRVGLRRNPLKGYLKNDAAFCAAPRFSVGTVDLT